jgi:hypothetical protein
LQLRECVRYHNHQKYLPIEFYIADTNRITADNKNINALYYQIDNHPREELITGMTNFRLRLYHLPHSKKNIHAVRIDFLLSSINDILKKQQSYWFNGKWLMPKEMALYLPGIIYVARRNA